MADPHRQDNKKPWKWNLKKVKSVVNRVRAGRELTPRLWPDGARVAVALSFDFDAETNSLRDSVFSPSPLSQGEYAARVAVPRILNLLDKYNLPATFFVPAIVAILHPEAVKSIIRKIDTKLPFTAGSMREILCSQKRKKGS
jgi:Polysaccharide deacetylase.